MEFIITLMVVVVLAGAATLIRAGGAEMLISGYNSATPEERAYMKEKGIVKFTANYLYALAGIILGGHLLERAGVPNAQEWSWLAFGLVAVLMVIRSRRFNPPGPPSPQRKRASILAVIILAVVAAVIAWNAYPADIALTESQLTISGAYGTEIGYTQIEKITLLEEMPPVDIRTNGISMGPINKGHFQLKDGRKVLMFLRNRTAPYLMIEFKTDHKPIILNQKSAEETTALYEQLQKQVE